MCHKYEHLSKSFIVKIIDINIIFNIHRSKPLSNHFKRLFSIFFTLTLFFTTAQETSLIDEDTLKKVELIKKAAEEAARLAEEENEKSNKTSYETSLLQGYNTNNKSFFDEQEEKDVWTYECKYIKGSTARRVLEQFISSEGRVGESAESDLIIVQDYKSN